MKIKKDKICLKIIFLLGSLLRFYNLNWDQGSFQHPDERNIINAASQIHFFDQLNPHFFAYNGLTIYLYKMTAIVIGWLSHHNYWSNNWFYLDIIGRYWGATISSLSLLIFYFLAKKLFKSKQVACFGSILMALGPTLIQNSHYATTENFLIFFILLISLFSLNYLEKSNFKNLTILAILLGLSLATKTSAITFLIPISLAIIYKNKNSILTIIKHFLFIIVLSFLIFFVFSPYTFLDYPHWLRSMNYEGAVVKGQLKVPYTLQFYKTTPYLYPYLNLAWQVNLFNFILFNVFFILWFLKFIQERQKIKPEITIVFSWPLIYFILVGSWYAKFLRYFLPLTPFIYLVIAKGLESNFKKLRYFIFILLLDIAWTAFFISFYFQPHPRFQASRWIYKHIPHNSVLTNEKWNDGLPLYLPSVSFTPDDYHLQEIDQYQSPSKSKLAYLIRTLNQSDYLILTSRRLWNTFIHLPHLYPLSYCYYRLLFNNQLGFKEIARFQSGFIYHKLSFTPLIVEETSQVFDHPQVLIYKKDHFNSLEVSQKLNFCYLKNKRTKLEKPFNQAVKFGEITAFIFFCSLALYLLKT